MINQATYIDRILDMSERDQVNQVYLVCNDHGDADRDTYYVCRQDNGEYIPTKTFGEGLDVLL